MFIASILSTLALCSCGKQREWQISEGSVWRTSYRIVYESTSNLDDSITTAFNHIELSLSPFNPNSLISRINNNSCDSTDSLIDEAFRISLDVNSTSNHRFDPTVSPLVNLWGFGTDSKARARVESDSDSTAFAISRQQIDSALTLVGISDCNITLGRMTKKHAGTTFNFSAVTKGLACDIIATMFQHNGIKNYMIEIGGEIALGGHNPENKLWRIQIDSPEPDTPTRHDALRIIELTGKGIATSGNYRNFHDTNRYGRIGHTIDPITGCPVVSDVLSATVIAPSAALADALATACMASPADSALCIISRYPETSCLLVTAAADSTAIIMSPSFPK